MVTKGGDDVILFVFLGLVVMGGLALQSLWEYLSPKYSPLVRTGALVAGLLMLPALYYIGVIA